MERKKEQKEKKLKEDMKRNVRENEAGFLCIEGCGVAGGGGGTLTHRFSRASAAASETSACQTDTADCSCMPDMPNSRCFEPCHIWNTVVVKMARTPRRKPGALR